MDRFSKLIEFAFAEGDWIVAYAAFDSVKCQGGWLLSVLHLHKRPSLRGWAAVGCVKPV